MDKYTFTRLKLQMPDKMIDSLVKHKLMKDPRPPKKEQLTPALFKDKALKMRTYKCQYDFDIKRIERYVEELGELWENDIQTSFIDDFNELQSSANEYSELLEEYASLLEMAAQELETQSSGIDRAAIFDKGEGPVNITLSNISYLKRGRMDLKAYDPYYERTQVGVSTEIRATRKGTDFMYNVYDDHIELLKYIGLKRTVVIPSELEGLPVTHIGQDCFAMAWRIKVSNITIPNSVTTVFHGAFRGCQHIKNLEIPDSVVYIGNYAFGFMTSLESLDIPNSVVSIGMGAFRNCTSLISVKIPSGVLRIGNDCFYRCKYLEEVEIGNDVVDIDGWAFKCCERLRSVKIGDSVVNIGASAFYDCILLQRIDVPENVEKIGEVAFHTRRGMTVGCYKDSVAEEYAIDNKLKYEYLE